MKKKPSVAKKLAELQGLFKRELPDKISGIEQSWRSFTAHYHRDELNNLHRMVHSLSGSGGTFGAILVSSVARQLEILFKSFKETGHPVERISSLSKIQVDELLVQLRCSADAWHPAGVPYIQPVEPRLVCDNNVIYLAEDDGLLAEDLMNKLEQADYQVVYFSDLTSFEQACKKDLPAAVIMDIFFKDDDLAGVNVINRLQAMINNFPPVIFISMREGIAARLAAARAGACRYFPKPLDVVKLTQTLDCLTTQTFMVSYKVLLVDDDETLLAYYSEVLEEAGMKVKALSNAFDCLGVLETFSPDVIVMDMYMPECSGPELTQVIRQDDAWALIPIMFLSTETDVNSQLTAMNFGADDFLVKPMDARHLVSAVYARAKRARRTSQLNVDLRNTLRESEFQLVAMSQHNIVSISDTEGCITFVNDNFCDISAYRRDELIGNSHAVLKSGYHPDTFYKTMWDTISQGKIWRGKICNQKKTGEKYWVDSTIVPFLNEQGKPYKYVSIRTDITELRASQKRMEVSQLYADIGTWDWDVKNDRVYWTDPVKKLYGYSDNLKKITSAHFFNVLHPDDRDAVDKAVKACFEHGDKYSAKYRVIWPDNSVRWVLDRGDVERDTDGKPLRLMGVAQDITDQVKAEAAMRDSEERFAFAVESAGDGVWDWDMSTNEVIYSDIWMKMLGYEPNELAYNFDTFSSLMHPSESAAVLTRIQDYLKGETSSFIAEVRMRCKDNGYKWVLSRGKVTSHDAMGRPVRMSGIHCDITQRKKTEKGLINAREEAEKANNAKSEFLSRMSHELRTPMNAIMGFAQLLLMETNESLVKSQKESVNEIMKASRHLMELINEVLDLSAIEAGHIELSPGHVVVSDVFIETVKLMMPLAKQRGIKIDLLMNGKALSLGELLEQDETLWVDRMRLKQILLNLLSNAIKYNCENGWVKIDCHFNPAGWVRISVSDSGKGLSEQQQSHLFVAFDRLGAEEGDVEGVGIGLVISKRIVELMGGRLGMKSELGKGSTFWIDIPRHQANGEV